MRCTYATPDDLMDSNWSNEDLQLVADYEIMMKLDNSIESMMEAIDDDRIELGIPRFEVNYFLGELDNYTREIFNFLSTYAFEAEKNSAYNACIDEVNRMLDIRVTFDNAIFSESDEEVTSKESVIEAPASAGDQDTIFLSGEENPREEITKDNGSYCPDVIAVRISERKKLRKRIYRTKKRALRGKEKKKDDKIVEILHERSFCAKCTKCLLQPPLYHQGGFMDRNQKRFRCHVEWCETYKDPTHSALIPCNLQRTAALTPSLITVGTP
jgi:hypothetical protein